jgi:hypothetical protein
MRPANIGAMILPEGSCNADLQESQRRAARLRGRVCKKLAPADFATAALDDDIMTILERSIAPPHPIVFIVDPSQHSEVPGDTGATLVTSTPSCITVGTQDAASGETMIRLGDVPKEPAGHLVFDGTLETPGRRVAVEDSGLAQILSMSVENVRTPIRIWVNDLSEPDLIVIQAV